MTKKRSKHKQRQNRKTKRIVQTLLDELVTAVDEDVNATDYFNIYKITNSEINYLIDLDVKNLDLLNGLHSEKVLRDDKYTKVYIRKNKIPDFENWIIYNNGDDKYLVSAPIIRDIRNNVPSTLYSDLELAKFYIENSSNLINTILYILNPSILESEKVEYTEEQKQHNKIRKILDDKNEAFNNRMKENPSIRKLIESRRT